MAYGAKAENRLKLKPGCKLVLRYPPPVLAPLSLSTPNAPHCL
jgi:hypothetical protein